MLSSKAYTEVYYIISLMSEELKGKIPVEVRKTIENKMDKSYEFYIEDDDFENTELLEDTEKILSVLYTDYLATNEEREIILNKEKVLKQKNKEVLPEIHINDIFGKKQDNTIIEEKHLVEKNVEKWYIKIIRFLKRILKK